MSGDTSKSSLSEIVESGNRNLLLDRLRQVEARVAEVRRDVYVQRAKIEQQERDSGDSAPARDVLVALEAVLTMCEEDRASLRRVLKDE
jgi:hypothetical protein